LRDAGQYAIGECWPQWMWPVAGIGRLG